MERGQIFDQISKIDLVAEAAGEIFRHRLPDAVGFEIADRVQVLSCHVAFLGFI